MKIISVIGIFFVITAILFHPSSVFAGGPTPAPTIDQLLLVPEITVTNPNWAVSLDTSNMHNYYRWVELRIDNVGDYLCCGEPPGLQSWVKSNTDANWKEGPISVHTAPASLIYIAVDPYQDTDIKIRICNGYNGPCGVFSNIVSIAGLKHEHTVSSTSPTVNPSTATSQTVMTPSIPTPATDTATLLHRVNDLQNKLDKSIQRQNQLEMIVQKLMNFFHSVHLFPSN